MATSNRRVFLAGCGVVGIGAMSASLPVTWGQIEHMSKEEPLPSDSGILVLVTLYGGNDGLNTVIPYTQDAYYDNRPGLAYAPENVIDLDGEYGFNPGMKGLGELFHSDSLAIIRGVGYPDQDRSHFRSMDIWQTGSTDNGVSTGWIGRWLDSNSHSPLLALNVGTVLPILAIGAQSTAATLSPKDWSRQDPAEAAIMSDLALPNDGDTSLRALVRESYRAASDASQELAAALKGTTPPKQTSDKSLAAQLDTVSRCIRAGLSTQVYCVSVSGFDTHANEKFTQQSLMKSVDECLTRFTKEISKHERGDKVVVMAYSEFGRRVAANASDGTDHGTSAPVLLLGKPVRGGFYGDEPSLTDLTNDDLKTTTDFRDIYAELLAQVLSTDPEPVVGKRNTIGFMK